MHTSHAALPALILLAGFIPLTAQTTSNQCTGESALVDPSSGSAWNGWGADISNSRFQTSKAAQLAASDVPGLKLKWAFGLAGAKEVFGEPVVAGGRVFVSDDTGAVYSLADSLGLLGGEQPDGLAPGSAAGDVVVRVGGRRTLVLRRRAGHGLEVIADTTDSVHGAPR